MLVNIIFVMLSLSLLIFSSIIALNYAFSSPVWYSFLTYSRENSYIGSIKLSLEMTKYKMVPLTAVGRNKLRARLISSSPIEFSSRLFSTSLDFILDCYKVVISSISSSTIPLDSASIFNILSCDSFKNFLFAATFTII